MKIIDLTHTIKPNMQVFPGTEAPKFELANTLNTDGFIENRITMYSHTGTHLDAPSHMLSNGKSLDLLEVHNFFGKATLVDLEHISSNEIMIKDLAKYEELISASDFVILHTGWGKRWGSPSYFDEYPCLNQKAAKWLTQFKLKGVGIDTISVDPIESKEFPVHHTLFNKGLIVIENLANLHLAICTNFIFSCLPLKIKDGDGSPIRAVAILE